MTDNRTPAKIQRDNLEIFWERGPSLDIRMGTYVVAKDEHHEMTLVGGLGCMGVGRMWCNGLLTDKPGYDEAPLAHAPGPGQSRLA